MTNSYRFNAMRHGAICGSCSHPYYMHPESGMTAHAEHCHGHGAAYMKRLPSGFETTAWHPCACQRFMACAGFDSRTGEPIQPMRLTTNG